MYTKAEYEGALDFCDRQFKGKTIYDGHPIGLIYKALTVMAGKDAEMVCVPREPTKKMKHAANNIETPFSKRAVWESMIAAAEGERDE